jgi:anti-sigma factor ChrR (cupin superfamily)
VKQPTTPTADLISKPGSLTAALLLLPGWRSLRVGVTMRTLYDDPAGHRRLALLHYVPGAQVPRHRHSGDEHVFILEGAQRDEYGEYPAGTYCHNPPNSEHSICSEGGCLVLIYWLGLIEFI